MISYINGDHFDLILPQMDLLGTEKITKISRMPYKYEDGLFQVTCAKMRRTMFADEHGALKWA